MKAIRFECEFLGIKGKITNIADNNICECVDQDGYLYYVHMNDLIFV